MTRRVLPAAAYRPPTKRRYADQLYPHPLAGQARPLAVDVPYLYARAVGLGTAGTGWREALTTSPGSAESREAIVRTELLLAAREAALTADALLQGLAGEQAWSWAQRRAADETGECVWERALFYGVEADRIRPYPCGPAHTSHAEHVEPGIKGSSPGTDREDRS